MSPPSRSPEQLRAALDRSRTVRRARSQLRDQLTSGAVTGSEVLASAPSDPIIAALPVRWLLLALPGIGPGRADDAMLDMGISTGRRLQGLGSRQHAALAQWLARYEGRRDRTASRPTSKAATAAAHATLENATLENPTLAPLVVVAGPSGVGKSTVVRAPLTMAPSAWLSISATTRSPRSGEVDGRDYHFVTPAAFESMISADELLEWATYAGNRYGTPRGPVQDHRARGVPVLLEIDVQGARQVRLSAPDARLVFIAPPSADALATRLAHRGSEDPAAMTRRLAIAREEMAAQREFDVVLVNADVQQTAQALVACLSDAAAP